jgi:hypothetical protein
MILKTMAQAEQQEPLKGTYKLKIINLIDLDY